LYGIFKLNNNNYTFDEKISVKIISPNFSLKDYFTKSEEFQIKRLIKISDPEKDKKTLFIWPEGIFYQSYLQDIKNNTLIIWGDKDKSYNLGQVQTLEKNISDSNLVIFKGCAHNEHLEHPDQFNHTIKNFLL